jgi:hypothetical protein
MNESSFVVEMVVVVGWWIKLRWNGDGGRLRRLIRVYRWWYCTRIVCGIRNDRELTRGPDGGHNGKCQPGRIPSTMDSRVFDFLYSSQSFLSLKTLL